MLRCVTIDCSVPCTETGDTILPYGLFFLKWAMIERFADHFSQHIKIEWDVVKSSLCAPPQRQPLRDGADVARVTQTFSHKLQGVKDHFNDENIHWICFELNSQLPKLELRPAQCADIASPLDLARHLAGIAQNNGWSKSGEQEIGEFAHSVIKLLTAPERLRLAAERPHGGAETTFAQMQIVKSRTDRGLAGARMETDPARFQIGDILQLDLSSPKGMDGLFDIYMWQSWDPRQLVPPQMLWDYQEDDNPFLLTIPPQYGVKVPLEEPLLKEKIVDDTGPGWHGLHLVGLMVGSTIADRCEAVVSAYRKRARQFGRVAGQGYDLVAHQWILREIHFHLGERKRDRNVLFAGHVSFNLVK
jgi:hypothetical protein